MIHLDGPVKILSRAYIFELLLPLPNINKHQEIMFNYAFSDMAPQTH